MAVRRFSPAHPAERAMEREQKGKRLRRGDRAAVVDECVYSVVGKFPKVERLSVVGRVEERRGCGRKKRRPVSPPRSSNRTCPLRASGFPTGFIPRLTRGAISLRLEIQLSLKRPDRNRCFQAPRQSPRLSFFESTPEARALPSAGVTRLPRYYDPLRRPDWPRSFPIPLEVRPPPAWASPNYPDHFPGMPCSLPRWTEQVRLSVASLSARPSPYLRRVGIHNFTFEACSSFTRVTACQFARPPFVGFVTRLRSGQLPSRTAR